MKRIPVLATVLAGATLTLSLALTVVSAGAARADDPDSPVVGCGDGYTADALSTHLRYRSAHWNIAADPDDGTLAVSAPRGWSFVRTPAGEGRFHDRIGNDLLSLRTATEPGSTAELMAAAVRDLAGTSGLKILGQHTKSVPALGQRWSTLSYSYRTSMSEPRTVKVRWIALGADPAADAQLVLTVAGRPMDAPGLDAMLAAVAPTVRLAD